MNKANYPKCATCKWAIPTEWIVAYNKNAWDGYFNCNSDNILEGAPYLEDNFELLRYEYNEGGKFFVGKDFGCIHHEDKTKST